MDKTVNKASESGDHCTEIRRRSGDCQIELIVDVGANVGETICRYLTNFEHAQIIAFEPVQKTFAALQSKVGSNPRVCCMNLALGAIPGAALVHHQPYSGLNSLSPAINTEHPDCGRSEMVTVTTLDRIVQDNDIKHIDLLKIDTEHFELEVIRGAHQALLERRISFIYAEVSFNPEDKRHTLFSELDECLGRYHFQQVGFFEHMFCPASSRVEFCNALFALKAGQHNS